MQSQKKGYPCWPAAHQVAWRTASPAVPARSFAVVAPVLLTWRRPLVAPPAYEAAVEEEER